MVHEKTVHGNHAENASEKTLIITVLFKDKSDGKRVM